MELCGFKQQQVGVEVKVPYPPSYKIVVAILGGWSGGNGDENYVYTQVCVCVYRDAKVKAKP